MPARKSLRQAVSNGFTNFSHLMKDPDFAPLRGLPDFAALLWELAEESAVEKK